MGALISYNRLYGTVKVNEKLSWIINNLILETDGAIQFIKSFLSREYIPKLCVHLFYWKTFQRQNFYFFTIIFHIIVFNKYIQFCRSHTNIFLYKNFP